MNTMIVVVFIALAVATINAGVIGGIATPLAAPVVASPGLISSPILARSVVASPLSAEVIAAPGIASPWGLSRSIVAGPAVLSAPIW